MATARKLSRLRGHRDQLLRNLLTSLVLNGRLTTTTAKAKTVRPLAEKLITLAKSPQLADRRQAASWVMTKPAMVALEKLAAATPGQTGLVRLVRTTPRSGDNAPRSALIIRQNQPVKEKAKASKDETKPSRKAATAKKAPEKAAESDSKSTPS